MKLGRIFIKTVKIFGIDYDDIGMEVEVFPFRPQTLRGDLYLSHIHHTKDVLLMTFMFPL